MKGDFTRDTFNPEKHYQHVLMQQGRVQLDADWNEQAAIASRRDETTTTDVIGACGGPADHAAFGITPVPDSPGDFLLSAGRFYVDGVQCELERDVRFTQQPDLSGLAPLKAGKYLIYLDVFQRHMTVLDDRDIREVALGGPDTATRVKTIWQVRAQPTKADNCIDAVDDIISLARKNNPLLKARTALVKSNSDPCLLPASAGYRGLENQLYRLEIHDGSLDEKLQQRTPTFKWSRENGSVVTAITDFRVEAAGTFLIVSGIGPDDVLGFKTGDVVELIDDTHELAGQPGKLARIDGNPTNEVIKLKPIGAHPLPTPADVDLSRHPKLRRWEGEGNVARPAGDGYIPLESGIEIRFDADGDGYRTGDYWLIPARTATADATSGDIEWPRELDLQGKPQNDKPVAQSPRGITNHYCRLAVLSINDSGAVTLVSDCRCLWPALTSIPRLFYVSGDGQEVMPDLTAPAGKLFKLPKPLIVGVANAHCLETATNVRFEVVNTSANPSSGLVVVAGGAPTATLVVVPLDSQGLAKCDFHLDGVHSNQQVTARLLDDTNNPVSLPIVFNANLSTASQVAYQPGGCAGLAGQKNVQDAIARLANMSSIYKISGDGQQSAGGATLKEPLLVRVASRCGPTGKTQVTFKVILGGGSISSNLVTTDVNGEAKCDWKLGSNSILQVVEAEVADDAPGPTTEPRRVHFVAHMTGEGTNDPAPVRIVEVRLRKPAQILRNDQRIKLDELRTGLAVLCNRMIDDQTVQDPKSIAAGIISRGQPTCFVTAELPFPILPSELTDVRNLEVALESLIGFRPLILHSDVKVEVLDDSPPQPGDEKPRGQINWIANPVTLNFLDRVLSRLNTLKPAPDGILLRLTLKGNFIWSQEAKRLFAQDSPGGYLDGESFRAPGGANILLPSGDNRRGGDFQMWFWIVP